MQTITARNPAEGIRIAVKRISEKGRLAGTDKGLTYIFDEPVMVHFTHPKECFVSDSARDADPFLVLIDTFGMLAGDTSAKTVVALLRSHPDSSQAVMKLRNNFITFRIRRDCLDIMVVNNDSNIVDGLFGDEPVKFSMLQRVVADHLGIPIGKYWACSNNVYMRVLQEEEITEKGGLKKQFYPDQTFKKIVSNTLTWDAELKSLVEKVQLLRSNGDTQIPSYRNGFLSEVVFKACVAYHYFERGEHSQAWLVADLIGDKAWRTFCTHWLTRRAQSD